MIIENIPYIGDKEERYASCQGPPTTMMAIKYFLPELDIDFSGLYRKMNYLKGNWFFEIYVVKLFYEYDIPAIYYSTKKLEKCVDEMAFKEISGLDIHNDEHVAKFNLEHYNESVEFVISHGLFSQVKKISVEFIKKQISDSKLVIATVNRNKLMNKDGYKGHFILIKGFTDDSFLCNDAFLGEGISIPFNIFMDSFYCVDWEKPDDETEYTRDVVVLG